MKTQSPPTKFELGLESYTQNDNFQHFGYFQWYLMMANKGYARAQYALGKCYQEGYGVEKNLQKAQRWFAQAEGSTAQLSNTSVEDQVHTLSII